MKASQSLFFIYALASLMMLPAFGAEQEPDPKYSELAKNYNQMKSYFPDPVAAESDPGVILAQNAVYQHLIEENRKQAALVAQTLLDLHDSKGNTSTQEYSRLKAINALEPTFAQLQQEYHTYQAILTESGKGLDEIAEMMSDFVATQTQRNAEPDLEAKQDLNDDLKDQAEEIQLATRRSTHRLQGLMKEATGAKSTMTGQPANFASLAMAYGMDPTLRSPYQPREDELRDVAAGLSAPEENKSECGLEGNTCVIKHGQLGICLKGSCQQCNFDDPDGLRWAPGNHPYKTLVDLYGKCATPPTSCKVTAHLSCNHPRDCHPSGQNVANDTPCFDPSQMQAGVCLEGVCNPSAELTGHLLGVDPVEDRYLPVQELLKANTSTAPQIQRLAPASGEQPGR